jgi:hypothetical protein
MDADTLRTTATVAGVVIAILGFLYALYRDLIFSTRVVRASTSSLTGLVLIKSLCRRSVAEWRPTSGSESQTRRARTRRTRFKCK